jgi:hypothetical protein
MAAKKKTAAKKPARRASAPAKTTGTRKPARATAGKAAKATARGGDSEVVYSDVLHELRKGLVSRLIR